MSDRDFEIGTRKFKLNKIDAFKQFHIARRVAPLLGEMVPLFSEVAKNQKNSDSMGESEKFDQFAKFVPPIMNGLSRLSDEDANKVLYGLLSSVEVKQSSGNWAKVATDTMLMMSDLELPILLNIAGRAFMFNIGGFFSALPQNS